MENIIENNLSATYRNIWMVKNIYLKHLGFECGVFLSYLDYFYHNSNNEFELTDNEIIKKLNIGLYKLKNIKKKLKDKGIIDFRVKGMPAKTHYKLFPKNIYDR